MARLNPRASAGNRFARLPPVPARVLLAGFVLLLALATLTAPGERAAVPSAPSSIGSAQAAQSGQDVDLQLYQRIAERVAAGENYYRAAIEEQRARGFPVRPGLAVRLPTSAWLAAALGRTGLIAAGAVLALAVALAWWRRLGSEPGGADRRVIAMLLLAIGALMGLKLHYLYLHEVWAGLLLALSFGLHRPGRWLGAWCAAALALAIREHALPFVLLMGALALWRHDWRESTAWGLLAGLFAAGLALHLAEVSHHLLPSDRESPPWLVFRGLEGWTSNLVLSSVLHLLPARVAAPLALLPLLGWAAWRSSAGLFGLLLHAGYGLFFMLAGRDNNFYWALVVIPTWFIGLAFVPAALASLGRAALGKT